MKENDIRIGDKTKYFLEGNITKVLIKLSIPVMLSNFMQTLYNLADMFWIGQYEKIFSIKGDLMAAIIMVAPIIFILLGFAQGIYSAILALTSQYLGAKDPLNARKTSAQAITISLFISVVIGIIGYFLVPTIVNLFDAEESVTIAAIKYLKIIILGAPTIFIMFAYVGVKQSQGDTVSPMLFSIISILVNIILDPILMIKFNMGIEGAAIATIISRGAFSIYAIITLFIPSKKHIKLEFRELKLELKFMKDILKIAIPASFSSVMTSFGFTILNKLIISYGSLTLSAFGIGNRITSLILMPANGIASSISAMVGANLGANNLKRVKKAVRTGFFVSSSLLITGGIFIFIFTKQIVTPFTDSNIILEEAIFYIKLIVLTLPLVSGFTILNASFIGAGHPKYSLILNISRLWVIRIPLVLILRKLSYPSYSVYYAMIVSNFIICIAAIIVYKIGKWEKKVIN